MRMILNDTRSYGNRETPQGKKRPQYERTARPKNQQEESESPEEAYEFAHFFWKPADPPSWPYWGELLKTLVALIITSLLEFLLILTLGQYIPAAAFLGAVLLAILLLINRTGLIPRSPFPNGKHREILRIKWEQFFHYSFLKGFEEVLFLKSAKTLSGVGLFRLKAVPIDLVGTFERFLRTIYLNQVPLFWMYHQVPLGPELALDKGFPAISEQALNYYEAKTPQERQAKLESHKGVMGIRIIFGSHRSVPTEKDGASMRQFLRKQVIRDLQNIRSAFKHTFLHTVLEPLKGGELLATYRLTVQQRGPPSFYVFGDEAVQHFVQVPPIVTKSLSYHYPAEFITPTQIAFDIPLGKTFETEFQNAEVPIGLRSQDLLRGMVVVGGTREQRFLTNAALVHAAAKRGMNYLILTNNSQWRRLLDILPKACLLRLGEDLICNPLNPERSELLDYVQLLTQAFAQCFPLSALGVQLVSGAISRCLGDSEDALSNLDIFKGKIDEFSSSPRADARELWALNKFLDNLSQGKMSLMLGSTNLGFDTLVQGIRIVEIDLSDQKHLQFLVLCYLAKALAFSHANPDRSFTILVDVADYLVPLDPQTQFARDTEQYFLHWVRRFYDQQIGLHLSLQTPSRFTPTVLANFKTVFAHQITTYEDMRSMHDLLQFLPDHIVLSREVRHDNWQSDFLKNLPPHLLLLKRPDINNPFPIELTPVNLTQSHVWTSEEIAARLKSFLLDWTPPAPDSRPLLERDFGVDTEIARDILNILKEYDRLGDQAILSSVNSQAGRGLEMPRLEWLLTRLTQYGYLRPAEWDDGRGHRHHTYQISDKGLELYTQYINALNARLQSQSTPLRTNSPPNGRHSAFGSPQDG